MTVVKDGEICLDIDECLDSTLYTCPDHSHCYNVAGGYQCRCDLGYKPSGSHLTIVHDGEQCVEASRCSDEKLHACPGSSICIDTADGYECRCGSDFVEPDVDAMTDDEARKLLAVGNEKETVWVKKEHENALLDREIRKKNKQLVLSKEDEMEIANGSDNHKSFLNVNKRQLWWTGFFSDEHGMKICRKETETRLRPVTNLECGGSYCDNVKLHCDDYKWDIFSITSYLPKKISSPDYVTCNEGDFVTGMECFGDYCSSIKLQCTEFKGVKWGRCEWTNWFSEEERKPYYFYTNGDSAVAGISCRGRYCDGKQLYMCPVEDIDECKNSSHDCVLHSHCVNTKFDFKCECDEGYEKDNEKCVDINECEKSNICPHNSKCKNTEGSYECLCEKGYEKSEDEKECKDIDECTNIRICPENSDCENTDGDYKCLCVDGYLNQETKTKLVKSGGTCKKMDFFDLIVGSTSINFKIRDIYKSSVDDQEIYEFEIQMHQREGSKRRSEVYGVHGETVSKDNAFKGYQVNGLAAGRRHYLTLIGKSKKTNFEGIEYPVSYVTHCSCNEEERTGRPKNFHVRQEEGHILFNFEDASMCEEAYAFTRSSSKANNDINKEVFTPNYFFFSRIPCASNPVSPGTQASDDLRISKLVVGQTYTYCVRAVAKEYMHNTDDDTQASLPSSAETCSNHKVLWEASINGKVTLNENYGSLPSEGVIIMWELLNGNMDDVIACGILTTKESGEFKVAIKKQTNLKKEIQYPVRITVAKQSGLITHRFLCDGGRIDCTETGTIVFVQHLEFNKFLHIIDDTSVSFTGKIVIEDTKVHAYDVGCGLIGAEVCLYNKNAQIEDTKSICVETNALGEYEAAAVIGSTVTVQVFYHNHTFVPLFPDYWEKWKNGILIESDGVYERNDFKDVSKTNIIVEVAGGLCNKNLGTSFIEVSISGGCRWTKIYTQRDYFWEHWVPAQILDVRVTKVVDDSSVLYHVQEKIQEVKTIDLRDIQKEKDVNNSSTNETEFKESMQNEKKQRTLRFQYDGDLTMQLIMTGDVHDKTCRKIEGYGNICNSIHVMKSIFPFELTVKLEYLLIKSRDLSCDIVSENMNVTMFNNLGLDGSKDDDKLKKGLSGTDLALLEACWRGCNVPVVHHEVNRIKSNAHVRKDLMTGLPNISGNHVKFLRVQFEGKTHIACVIVTGDFKIENGPSFGLPTHKPVLIIRDPPGGLSYASYENVQTSTRISMESLEKYFGLSFHIIGGVVADMQKGLCAGLGIANCEKIGKLEAFFGGETEQEKPILTEFYDKTLSKGFTTTWSYTTSEDAWLAGNPSDTFVVPNINIQFDKVTEIKWNETQCSAFSQNSIKFDLKAPENKPALSFLSLHNIEKYQIPELELAHKTKLAQKANEREKNKIDQIDKEIELVKDALKGWRKALEGYNTTNDLSTKTDIAKCTIKNWFDHFIKDNDDDLADHEFFDHYKHHDFWPSKHWNGLLSESLVNGAESLGPSSLKGTTHEDIDLTNINRIHFSGGGSTLEFSMKYHRVKEHIEKIGSNDDNWKWEARRYGGWELKYSIVGVGHEFDNFEGSISEQAKSTKGGDESELETQISFVLGDEQISDEFVVDILFDPKFGTLMFHTVSGHSRCPNESNTLAVEDPRIQMISSPSQEVLPDDQMIFSLRLANVGVGSSAFELFVDHRENVGLLSHDIAGGNLARPLQYDAIAPGQEIYTTLSIRRGPLLYKYLPLTLYFRSACEGVDNIGDGNNLVDPIYDTQMIYNKGIETDGSAAIVFAQPCPKVRFAGNLQEEQSFLVNLESSEQSSALPVTIFNSDYSRGNFSHLVKNDRLEEVTLMYREVERIRWKKAKMKNTTEDGKIDLVSVDFSSSGKEDDYGYATLEWAWKDSGIYDGIYEIRMESRCTPIEGAPDYFNTYVTPPIMGVIDRIQPMQYGSPSPHRSFVWPGEEIAIVFTEPVLCEKPFNFNLKVSISGVNRTYDVQNLNTICERRKIGFTFKMKEDFSKMMGETISVTLADVKDVNGNAIKTPIIFSKPVANLNLDEATTSFIFSLDQNCTGKVGEDTVAGIQNKIANLLGLSSVSRIQVSSAVCKQQERKVIAHVTMQAAKSEGRRRLHGLNYRHSLGLFHLLMKTTECDMKEKLNSNVVSHFSLSDLFITPGPSDVKRFEETSKKHSHRALSRKEEKIEAFDEMILKEEQMSRMQNYCDRHWEKLTRNVEKDKEAAKNMEKKVEALDKRLDNKMKDLEKKLTRNMEEQMDALGEKIHQILNQLLA